MQFSKSFWVAVISGSVICSAGIIGMVYYLSFPAKWNTGIDYSRFWHWLPTASTVAVWLGVGLIAAWLIICLISRLISHSRHGDIQSLETKSTSMKTSQFIFVCLLIFGLSSALAFLVGVRIGFHQAYTKEWSDYLERGQENGEFEARAYFRCLQDIDSGGITNLHDFALTHLRAYVSNVQDMRSDGYTWAPHIPSLYSNAVIYVREHPRDENHRPDTH